ncbi:MAG: PEP-CTERM sorting domain-containing protein [Chthoniobacterales bacterium]
MLKSLLLILATISISIAGAQTVIINDDFETPPYETSQAIVGWTVFGNVGEVSEEGSTSGSHAAAFNVGGNSEGNMLSQSFATLTGQTYTVEFDATVFGIRTAGPLSLQIQVFGPSPDPLLDETVTPPDNGNFHPPTFQHYSYTFVADASATTVKFTDIGLGNASADLILDTVSVAPINEVPEPATIALSMLGALPVAIRLMRQRKTGR